MEIVKKCTHTIHLEWGDTTFSLISSGDYKWMDTRKPYLMTALWPNFKNSKHTYPHITYARMIHIVSSARLGGFRKGTMDGSQVL